MFRPLLGAILVWRAAAAGSPVVCLSQPPISLTAGSPMAFDIDNPFNATCEAVLTYSDAHFLPVTFIFEPITCSGTQLAQLIVPPESPDGDAVVTFRCAGQTGEACNDATISNGANRSDIINGVQNGLVGCIEPTLVPTTLLETATSAGTQVVHTVTSLMESSFTSFPPDATPTVQPVSMMSTSSSGTSAGTSLSTSPSPGTTPSTAATSSNNSPSESTHVSSSLDFTDGVFQTTPSGVVGTTTPSMSLTILTTTLTIVATTTTFSTQCAPC